MCVALSELDDVGQPRQANTLVTRATGGRIDSRERVGVAPTLRSGSGEA
jgi:hypothetical protein